VDWKLVKRPKAKTDDEESEEPEKPKRAGR
jgi:hypothetical protein